MSADLLDDMLAGLIPASASAPSGAGLGVPRVLRRLAESDPVFDAALQTCLTSQGAPVGPDTLSALEQAHPEAFALLLRHAYMAYYSQPAARALLGLSPEPTQPKGYAVPSEPAERLAALTAPVTARGACYRPTPEPSHD